MPSSDPRYGQAAYKKARKAILGPAGHGSLLFDPPCWKCGRPATTADHVPPVEVVGWHLNLRPACRRCNYGGGPRAKQALVDHLRARIVQLEAALRAAGVRVPAVTVAPDVVAQPAPESRPAAPDRVSTLEWSIKTPLSNEKRWS